jgi:hypothetical protein
MTPHQSREDRDIFHDRSFTNGNVFESPSEEDYNTYMLERQLRLHMESETGEPMYEKASAVPRTPPNEARRERDEFRLEGSSRSERRRFERAHSDKWVPIFS